MEAIVSVARLQEGEPEALEAFVREHAGAVRAVAVRVLGTHAHAADDVVQDTFLRALKALKDFRGQSQLSTWVHRIAVNASLRARERLAIDNSRTLDEQSLPRFLDDGHHAGARAQPWQTEPYVLASRREVRALVRERVDSLPEDYRNVVLLRDIEMLSTREAAEALGVTENNVKVRLHRARQILRKQLSDAWGTE